ncbi:MAG: MCE family protein [Thermoleophilaceae bacterium]|nr:MCE family protein [Thermoleophilaceae bacterium]
MRRVRVKGLSPFKAGLIAAIVIAIVSVLVFTKDIPFTQPYTIKAVFANTASLAPRSPVRIAGVDVGQVKKVEPFEDGYGQRTSAAVVTMQIEDKGLPIHRDATVKIRPRIFLEGNFFVQIDPGTPSAPTLHSGDTIPMTQTRAPVQIDQVLATLQTSTRTSLQKLLVGYGDALNGQPLPGEDDDQDPAVRGETAGKALNQSLRYSPDALRGTAVVNEALLGVDPHDLSKLVAGTQKVSAALNANEGQLQDLVTNFNRTVAAFAAEQGNLRETIRLLPGVLGKAERTFTHLTQSYGPTQQFAHDLIPGVKETPATIDAAYPWIAQTRRLVSPAELGGLVADLRPAVRDLASTTDVSLKLIPQLNLLARCTTDVIVPTGDKPIDDRFATGLPNYQEFWQSMVGLAGESQNFDGNGPYTRFQTGGGFFPVRTGRVTGTAIDTLYGNAIRPILGTQPTMPAKTPPIRTDVPCYRNGVPNLTGRIGAGP